MLPVSANIRNLVNCYLVQGRRGQLDPLVSEKRFQSSYSFEDKVCLVTGGAHGIGFHIAEKILEAGARAVSLLGRNEEKGHKANTYFSEKYGKDRAMFIKCDALHKDQLEDGFKQTICEFCGLDIVVNNAGILKDEIWEEEIDLNCKGVVTGSLLACKYMGKNAGGKGGIVINVASIYGLDPFPGYPVYGATKHFVVGFDRSMGTEFYYDLTGIKFMTICPGVTDTTMVHEATQHPFKEFPGLPDFITKGFKTKKIQSVENVGVATVEMICQGKNGSIWITEDEENYEVQIPHRKTLREKGKEKC